MLASGKIDVKPMITHNFTLEETLKAFEMAKSGAGVKVIIDCEKKEWTKGSCIPAYVVEQSGGFHYFLHDSFVAEIPSYPQKYRWFRICQNKKYINVGVLSIISMLVASPSIPRNVSHLWLS